MSDGKCSASICRAEIAWVTLTATGKKHPIDRAPEPHGNIAITGKDEAGRPQAVVLSRALRESWDGPLYVSHFATCRAAGRFRR